MFLKLKSVVLFFKILTCFLLPRPFGIINYCFLLARYSIWLAKSKETPPNLSLFLGLVKLRYEIESEGGDINLTSCRMYLI